MLSCVQSKINKHRKKIKIRKRVSSVSLGILSKVLLSPSLLRLDVSALDAFCRSCWLQTEKTKHGET